MNEQEVTPLVEENNENEKKKPVSAADLRYAAWFVLVIAAIFIVNAMETGSYRTPSYAVKSTELREPPDC